MIYDFEYAIKRWKEEDKNEDGILKYYKEYKSMKPGTVENYTGFLYDFRFLNDILKIVGAELPKDFQWSEVPEDDKVGCLFTAKGDLSEYSLKVFYVEKLYDNDPDHIIVSSTGSLTAEQFSGISNHFSMEGSMEATIFIGFSEEANADCLDELSPQDFVRYIIMKM